MHDFEKLGAFYLGRERDPATGRTSSQPLLYDSKDLTTHAVCVGMTGSGKTGLCLTLLEEAAIDGIPAIAIDPKGDLGNLLLTFPQLRPEDFEPWVDAAEAARHGMSPTQFAAQTARDWKAGLAAWGQDGNRIANLRAAVEMAIYTPGGTAGLPLTVLRSFHAPPPAVLSDTDALRECVVSAVSGLLVLLGIDPDPIRSREHILLCRIFETAWQEGRDLDLAGLIREIQSPPFDKVGFVNLETFFPETDRFGLAMTLNNLAASPGFAGWLQGEPLDIGRLLHTAEGKPRLSIMSIAHLSETERMFFVTVLLNEVIAWMRSQPGTSSLRAVLYMDEVFGYFPPTANPPSKVPMLTLLKQARAYGLGVVLATQNPVDLDYKGLSNAGTWFLGRLQTERDKARVLDGLEGAVTTSGAKFDRGQIEAVLSGLSSRVFLMNNVHEDEPVVFETRWAMSYLRGPLTREHIARLTADRVAESPAPASRSEAVPEPSRRVAVAEASAESARPVVPPGIAESFLPCESAPPAGAKLIYRPALIGLARLHYVDARADIDHWTETGLMLPVRDAVPPNPWDDASLLASHPELSRTPAAGGAFHPLPTALTRSKSYTTWTSALKTFLYRERTLAVFKCPLLKANSAPPETEGEFRVRVTQLLHEQRDLEVEKLRKKYAPKLAAMQDRIRRAEDRVDREKAQVTQSSLQTALSFGTTVLGALFGRKLASATNVSRAATSMRSAGRIARDRADVARAEESVEDLQEKFAELEEEFAAEVEKLKERFQPDALEIEPSPLRPRKSDITVETVALVWTPWLLDESGFAEPLYSIDAAEA